MEDGSWRARWKGVSDGEGIGTIHQIWNNVGQGASDLGFSL